jgi:hypothetical protein
MIEKNYTIPINEQFDKFDGCALCRLENILEERSLDYIMGAAMMEPSVRIETNKVGFCAKHYGDMLQMKNRLSLALMLESHLAELRAAIALPDNSGKKLLAEAVTLLSETADGCFVCNRVASTMIKYYENIVYLWHTEPEFRNKLIAQPEFCFTHAVKLLKIGQENLNAKSTAVFAKDIFGVLEKSFPKVCSDIGGFCKSFDYRFADKPLSEDEKFSVENAVKFLIGSK